MFLWSPFRGNYRNINNTVVLFFNFPVICVHPNKICWKTRVTIRQTALLKLINVPSKNYGSCCNKREVRYLLPNKNCTIIELKYWCPDWSFGKHVKLVKNWRKLCVRINVYNPKKLVSFSLEDHICRFLHLLLWAGEACGKVFHALSSS